MTPMVVLTPTALECLIHCSSSPSSQPCLCHPGGPQHLLLGQYRITGAEYWSCWEGVNMPSTQHTLYEVRKGKLTNK